jgi:hypothetical protein
LGTAAHAKSHLFSLHLFNISALILANYAFQSSFLKFLNPTNRIPPPVPPKIIKLQALRVLLLLGAAHLPQLLPQLRRIK